MALAGAAGRGGGCALAQDRGGVSTRRCCAARRAGPLSSALRARSRVLHVICAADDSSGSRSVHLEVLRRKRANRPQPQPARPPAELQRQHSSRHRPTREQLQLNADIRACESAYAVLDLVAAQRAVLNEVNASTALMRLQRCAGKRAAWLRGDPRFAQLLSAAESLFARMGPQELANTLYACGQLSFTPPPDWLDSFWSASSAKLGEFKPQELSNTFYACSQLGITPPADWLERFWHASALMLDEFNPQELSNTLYACGQLGITPPAGWMERFWHASASKLGEFNPQELSNTLYACGQLDITPPDHWLERFWHASALKVDEFNPQALSNTLYACGQLGITPPDYWLERFWHASASKLGEFVPQALSNTLYASGQLGITPPDYWLERFWHTSALKLGEFKPQELSNTLYACGQLRFTPPADWLQRFFHFSAAKLGDFKPQESSNTILACGLLDTLPPAAWLQSFSETFKRTLPDSKQQELTNTALALAMLTRWELPLWRGLWERLCASLSRDIAGWRAENRLDARQLYQAYQAAAVEQPGLLPAPSAELLSAARACWVDEVRDGTDNVKTSRLHAGVSACMTRMGVAHANELWCERAERSIDIAIEGAVPVAVEVDGPYHFLQDGRQDGSTLLRNRLLAAHGWRVVVVDYRKWNSLQTEAQREEYLRRLLA